MTWLGECKSDRTVECMAATSLEALPLRRISLAILDTPPGGPRAVSAAMFLTIIAIFLVSEGGGSEGPNLL